MRLLICMMFLLLAGCNDDNLYGINSDTRAYLLLNKKWQNSAIFVKSPQGIVIRDEYSLLPPYRKDDYFFFRADSTFELNDNAAKDPGVQGNILSSGTWDVIMKEQFLRLKEQRSNLFPDSIKISSINETNLTIERPVADGVQFISYKVIN